MDDATKTRLWTLFLYSRMHIIASRIWDVVLTDEERAQCPGGLDAAKRLPDGLIGIYAVSRNVPFPRAIIEVYREIGQLPIGEACYLLHRIGEAAEAEIDSPVAERVRGCIERGDLVLLDYSPRKVFWKGKRVRFDWDANSKCWKYLQVLAEEARLKRPIDYKFFSSRSKTYPSRKLSYFRKKRILPDDLLARIVKTGDNGQRLDILRSNIHIVEKTSQTGP